ncbi:pterin-4-alpha-carbinolamine dehydratase [Andreprevotia lacus DSM 23236]|jgi:4a-hydroxytetrahydrobiopterin dehydratase|uniref:Putative pterin-4-alpha-carbinolamine dehydratase n=1 Tax=Andreprevotia lacus DSM 23236 TaxID=1121001 RepID=A0A1W1XEJ7_9NEIS|nr:4a-hydroxytetrahydrobiopterin dehydratase [Andreprevotia lacus]SMC22204.1 pterin-4-alpha-carbinolamine dehydratase [Andreprevotia lacus DSM 23236]
MPLATERCQANAARLDDVAAEMLASELREWLVLGGKLEKTFRFKDFYQTMAFVNAVAYIANQQDHHPDLEVTYSRCRVVWSTHSAGGLSRNDFICAARIDAL